MTEAEKIYHRFVNYEWNEVSDSLKESILKAINEALKQRQSLPIHSVSISLRDKLEDFVAKYWYDNEYQHIDKQDHTKATESRKKLRMWFDNNIEAFLKQ